MHPLPCLWPGQDKGMSKGAKHSNDQNPSFLKPGVMPFFLVAVLGGSP